jgi:hypothetical protein
MPQPCAAHPRMLRRNNACAILPDRCFIKLPDPDKHFLGHVDHHGLAWPVFSFLRSSMIAASLNCHVARMFSHAEHQNGHPWPDFSLQLP